MARVQVSIVQKFSISKPCGRLSQTYLCSVPLQWLLMDARRQQAIGLAMIALLILIIVLLRRFWSGA
jgi:hypothetical protein